MYLSGGFLTLLGYLDVTCLVGVSFAVVRAGSGWSFSEWVLWFSHDPSFVSGVQISGHSITTSFPFTIGLKKDELQVTNLESLLALTIVPFLSTTS